MDNELNIFTKFKFVIGKAIISSGTSDKRLVTLLGIDVIAAYYRGLVNGDDGAGPVCNVLQTLIRDRGMDINAAVHWMEQVIKKYSAQEI